MKVLHVASECTPLVKVGGLADVVGALPKALLKEGVETAVAIPFYQKIKNRIGGGELVMQFDHDFNAFDVDFDYKKHKVYVSKTNLPGSDIPLYLFENEAYLSPGPYDSADAIGKSVSEEVRFSFFCAAVASWGEINSFDVVHCHDKHASLLTREIKDKGLRPKTVLTIHNLGNKGGETTGLMVGITNADFVTTVSPQYAREILTSEFGEGLEELLRKRNEEGKLVGILNGIDEEYWDPRTDRLIDYQLKDNLSEFKVANKRSVFERFGLSGDLSNTPLFAVVSRIASQKGLDVMIDAWEEHAKTGNGNLVIEGQGDPQLIERIKNLVDKYKGRVGYCGDFDEKTAHELYAGSDFFLIPSRFEPCGLTQMFAMRYGTVPIVNNVGGLHDTVVDGLSGIVIDRLDMMLLTDAFVRAVNLYRQEDYGIMRERIITLDWSWDKSAKKYIDVYRIITSS